MSVAHTVCHHPTRASVLLLALCSLAACGGGGSSDAEAPLAESLVVGSTADATMLASDADSAVETSIATAEVVVMAQAAEASSDAQAAALSATSAASPVVAQAVAEVPVACPGGGQALLSISGGTVASVLNGQLDAGEVYALSFTDCRGAAGGLAQNGEVAFTVTEVNGDQLAVQWQATALRTSLPNGSLQLDGSLSWRRSSQTLSGDTQVWSCSLSTSELHLQTGYNTRSGSYTLSALSHQRTLTWQAGVIQSAELQGTHTMSAMAGSRSGFSYTVSTQGRVSYDATGLQVTGVWLLTLPSTAISVKAESSSVTLSVDDGKDGSVDRSITLPVGELGEQAG